MNSGTINRFDLDTLDVFWNSVGYYWHHRWLIFTLGCAILVPALAIELVIYQVLFIPAFRALYDSRTALQQVAGSSDPAIFERIMSAFTRIVVSFAIVGILQNLIVHNVFVATMTQVAASMFDGRERRAWTHYFPRPIVIARLIGATLLYNLFFTILLIVMFGCIVGFGVILESALSTAVTLTLAVICGLVFVTVVAGIFYSIARLYFYQQAIVLGQYKAFSGLRASWHIVPRAFKLIALVAVSFAIISAVVGMMPTTTVPMSQLSSPEDTYGSISVVAMSMALSSAVGMLIWIPYHTFVTTWLYLRLSK